MEPKKVILPKRYDMSVDGTNVKPVETPDGCWVPAYTLIVALRAAGIEIEEPHGT